MRHRTRAELALIGPVQGGRRCTPPKYCATIDALARHWSVSLLRRARLCGVIDVSGDKLRRPVGEIVHRHAPSDEERDPLTHSCRSATSGSTRAARAAGV